eukprot:1454045-Amphidinium_carterae.1
MALLHYQGPSGPPTTLFLHTPQPEHWGRQCPQKHPYRGRGFTALFAFELTNISAKTFVLWPYNSIAPNRCCLAQCGLRTDIECIAQ